MLFGQDENAKVEETVSVLLTTEEVAIIRDALEAWAESAKKDMMLGGLVFSAILSKDVEGESDRGHKLREEMELAGKNECERRRGVTYKILAKLY
jgi:hypothetical protein